MSLAGPLRGPERDVTHAPRERAGRADLALTVGAAQAGDRLAFERLVVVTAPEIYALALRLVGNEHDASDVFQETYLRALRALPRFRGEAAFSSWLYRIAANCSADLLRRRGRARHLELEDGFQLADERSPDPAASAGAAEDRARLVEALAALPETLRAVVVLHDVYELPHEVIARELGISRTAARVRLHRARRRLREELFPSGAVREEGGGVGVTL
jgi:RNA polymerase sigma-70 factor (ECF subfamily)